MTQQKEYREEIMVSFGSAPEVGVLPKDFLVSSLLGVVLDKYSPLDTLKENFVSFSELFFDYCGLVCDDTHFLAKYNVTKRTVLGLKRRVSNILEKINLFSKDSFLVSCFNLILSVEGMASFQGRFMWGNRWGDILRGDPESNYLSRK